ncbi:class I SAM-dependent methyltransferase [Thalassobacillus sp. CUG 92003]|uniref:class I SAM-dependent methyltransferase n=1 Tax=Thalassobacillus sp. CUG 92003 TaxID=2736641 RepID=UPI0015E74943|nr:class I SAM-dependent methyltransferase [Thalassobacillus sp. CUG 92003]
MEHYFYEAFAGLERLAPGSKQSTRTAMSLVRLDREKAITILDVGCGTGISTICLAEFFPNARITAIDTHEPYLEVLKQQLNVKGLASRVDVQCLSMTDMDFPPASFDLIWAEGSIYIAGFQTGLTEWRSFLKPEGYLVCSEISWLHANPAEESKAFWEQGYPEIATIADKISQIDGLDYAYEFSFVLPEEDWMDEYYGPLEGNLQAMEERYPDNAAALNVVSLLREEIKLYHNHVRDYTYVFYGMKKV